MRAWCRVSKWHYSSKQIVTPIKWKEYASLIHTKWAGKRWRMSIDTVLNLLLTPSLKQLIPGSEGPFLETYFFGHFSLRLSGNNCSRVISMGNFGPTASNLRYEILTIFGWRLEPSCDHTLGAGLDLTCSSFRGLNSDDFPFFYFLSRPSRSRVSPA